MDKRYERLKSEMTAQQCHSCFLLIGEVIIDQALADASLKEGTRFWLKPGCEATEVTKHCPGVMAGVLAKYMLELHARDKTRPCTLYHVTSEPVSHFFPTCVADHVHLNETIETFDNLTHRQQCSLYCLTNENCNAFEHMMFSLANTPELHWCHHILEEPVLLNLRKAIEVFQPAFQKAMAKYQQGPLPVEARSHLHDWVAEIFCKIAMLEDQARVVHAAQQEL